MYNDNDIDFLGTLRILGNGIIQKAINFIIKKLRDLSL
jgi:hypothetical protein